MLNGRIRRRRMPKLYTKYGLFGSAGKNDEKRAMVCTGQYVFFGLSAKGTIILIVVIQ